MRPLELKIPPPVVALVLALLMWFASSLEPTLQMTSAARVPVALALLAVGLGFSVAGMTAFLRAKTTMDPTKPTATSSLVDSGVYRFTRNPMYLGLLFDLLAWAVFLSHAMAFTFLPVYILYITRFQIIPEERALSAMFGAEYAAYKQKTRRWL